RQGLPLRGFGRAHYSLYRAACFQFGSWHQAVTAAGFDSQPRLRWSRERVIQEIRAWYRAGIPTKSAWRDNPQLIAAARRYFGTWRSALRAAEVEPPRKWSSDRVIEAIQN